MRIKRGAVVAGTVALALGLSACGGGGSSSDNASKGASGYNAGVHGIVNPSEKKGGTLRFGYTSDVDSLDPTRIYYASGQNFMRAFYNRTLLTPASKPGADGLILEPDMAEVLPEISADKLTYTFKLKKGLKFEDGTPVTSKDVKYGIERSFATDVLSGGPPYLKDMLDQGQNYPGPYKDTDPEKLGLKSVQTPDDSTIVFKLAAPFSDFPYLLVMAAGAVPKAKDTGEKYTNHPVSTGPYMVEKFDPGKKLTMVRNPNWDPATDKTRKALPDRIEMTLQMNADELDKQLLDGTLDLDFGQTGVQQAAQAKILLDPNLKKNADAPNNGAIRYAALSTQVAPFDNVHCRKAVQYATDKTAIQTARGGSENGGDIAVNMLPPNIGGHDPKLDPYNTKSGKPQVDKAKEELKLCGKPNGFETKIAVRNKGKEPKMAEALQQSLAAVGIKATIDQSDASLYFRSTIGSPANVHSKGYGIMVAGWLADFPTGYGYLDVLVDGRLILPSGNNNYEELNDPEINSLIDQAKAEPDAKKAQAIWSQINAKVMDTASLVPFVYEKAMNYRNPRLTNVFQDQYWGEWSFGQLGVSDGK
ncbi:ABC transporter substrate-binding protein [Planosporangium flavigriseum]|uniref:Peptide ABC transporter substrate-binding protein n=1 Tax=Planosporangium flavigriseum TaxID=373681 RepID=A0A8J3PM13_9ACTN|nr:ABC transporter substrate-binding protein [Planosporangium flavigriseum]GIG74432.1 peptide ABC transporter substrate-binding protein [Planosporangium flavigriseum]